MNPITTSTNTTTTTITMITTAEPRALLLKQQEAYEEAHREVVKTAALVGTASSAAFTARGEVVTMRARVFELSEAVRAAKARHVRAQSASRLLLLTVARKRRAKKAVNGDDDSKKKAAALAHSDRAVYCMRRRVVDQHVRASNGEALVVMAHAQALAMLHNHTEPEEWRAEAARR